MSLLNLMADYEGLLFGIGTRIMIRRALALYILICGISNSQCLSDETAQEFQKEVSNLYNFSPHNLNSEQITDKSNQLDIFWEKVKSNTDVYLPLLRDELKKTKDGSFFLYDGSKLLLSLSTNRDDKLMALRCIPRTDLRDIQQSDYLYAVHSFAVEEFNTTEAAFKILDDEDYRAIIPQHALTLGQNYSFIYMLIPTKEQYYLDQVFERLKTETRIDSQKTLLLLLWYSVTEKADLAISEFSTDISKPLASKDYAKELIDRTQKIKSNVAPMKDLLEETHRLIHPNTGYSDLKEIRRKRMNRISDEALIEFDALTYMIRKREVGNSTSKE